MQVTVEHLQLITRFNYRITDLAKSIATIHNEHNNHDSDSVGIRWEFDDDDNPSKVYLYITSYDYHNTSCSCHPTYEFNQTETQHVIPLEEITSDEYFYTEDTGTYYRGLVDSHPELERIKEQQLTEKQRKALEEQRKREEEERIRKIAEENRERAELARLKQKYGN